MNDKAFERAVIGFGGLFALLGVGASLVENHYKAVPNYAVLDSDSASFKFAESLDDGLIVVAAIFAALGLGAMARRVLRFQP